MALTVDEALEELESRVKGYLDVVKGKAGEENPISLVSCFSWAFRMLGMSTASFRAVTDSEMALVDAGKQDALLDLAELRALQAVQTNLTHVSTTVGSPATGINTSHSWGQLLDQINTLVTQKQAAIQAQHGWALTGVLSGQPIRIARLESL